MTYENYEDLSVNEAKALLRKWRETNERRSKDVVKIWTSVLMDSDKMGNEAYVIMEQVIIAAIDCRNEPVADQCLNTLSSLFPGSLRVMVLYCLFMEGQMSFDEAEKMITYVLSKDTTNVAARKRRIAIHKAKGEIVEAINMNSYYLTIFMSDVEMWNQQCDLYLMIGDLQRAVFCAEEPLLHQPHNHLLHQRVADIRYTMGGTENYELAKAYYCHALKLNPDNMRALFGLVLVTNHLLNQYKSSGSTKRKDIWKLNQWAASTATRKQKEANPNITEMMLSLAITE